MKLLTYETDKGPRCGVLQHGQVVDVSALLGLNGHYLRDVRALLERDPIGLSDTLLYELPGIVEEWRSILDTLKRQIEGEGQEPCR